MDTHKRLRQSLKELFDSWVSLTATQKKAVMQMIRTLNENK